MRFFDWKRVVTCALFGVLCGCVGYSGEPGDGAVVSSWRLIADESGALIDARDPSLRPYPNAAAFDWLQVQIMESGKVCANDGNERWCGGPAQGIPYTVRGNVIADSLCMRVVDLFGAEVSEHCGLAARTPSEEPAEARCHEATTSSGAPCQICTDEGGQVTENTCVEVGEFTEPPATSTCADADIAVRLGAQLFVQSINEGFARMGLEAALAMPPEEMLAPFDEGDISLGDPSCADIYEYLDDEFSDDHVGTDDYVFGPEAMASCLERGNCRIGQLVTRSMAEACVSIPAGCDLHQVSRGIVGSGGYAVVTACPGEDQAAEFRTAIDDCVGSPLVLDLDGDGLALNGADAGARFPLFGGAYMSVGWIAGEGDALLAVDLDGDGAITRGAELFGEASGGGAADGFDALARYDHDGDGQIAGDELESLLAWRDDGDAVSEPGELIPVTDLGLSSIPLAAQPVWMTDATGNELGTQVAATLADGGTMPIVDVWFDIGN